MYSMLHAYAVVVAPRSMIATYFFDERHPPLVVAMVRMLVDRWSMRAVAVAVAVAAAAAGGLVEGQNHVNSYVTNQTPDVNPIVHSIQMKIETMSIHSSRHCRCCSTFVTVSIVPASV